MTIDRGDKPPNRVLLKASWICSAGVNWAIIDKADQADFFKSIIFAVPSLIQSMQHLSIDNICLEGKDICEACSPRFPPVYWVVNSESSNLQPIHKPDEVGAYERGLRSQLPAFQVMAKVPPYEKSQKDNMVSVRFTMNPSRLAHRALAYLPNARDTLAHNASSITMRAFVEPGHSDSLVFNLRPFVESIQTVRMIFDGDCGQPPNFPRGLRLDKSQLFTVGHMINREKSPRFFIEREDEEEVVPGVPLRLVGRVERKVKCSGGVIADSVGAGKTVMTLALIDHQAKHDNDGYSRRSEICSEIGAMASKATLLIVPEHISTQWLEESLRFLKNLQRNDVIVLQTMRDLTSPSNLKKITEARLVIACDKLFKENQYRAELSKYAGRIESGKMASERVYRAWYRECVLQVRQFLARYLRAQHNHTAKQMVANDIQTAFQEAQALNQELVEGIVKKSTRKGAKGQKQSTTTSLLQTKTRPLSGARMFMDACILLEFFSWPRIVWDEVSYRNTEVAQFLSAAVTDHKWLLSGTPPRQNLSDIDYLARALGISLVRPVNLRLGLPSITKGPMETVQTDTELCCSYGKLKSDKFVKDRHEQAEIFLKTLSSSNKAPALNVSITERVFVCSPTLIEKAIYMEKEQVWRRAQMLTDNLAAEDLRGMLRDIGHPTGTPFPDDLISRILSFAASLPTFGKDNGLTLSKMKYHRDELLRNIGTSIRHLFQQAIWLARRLEQCNNQRAESRRTRKIGKQSAKSQKKDESIKDAEEIAHVTASLRGLVSSLQHGDFETFGGIHNYLALLKVLIPGWDLDSHARRYLLNLAKSRSGVDLVALHSMEIKPSERAGDDLSILHDLYEQGDFSWANFYRINSEDVGAMDQANVLSLTRESLSKIHDRHTPENEEKLRELGRMTLAQLRQTLKDDLPMIKSAQEDYRQKLADTTYDEKAMATKHRAGLMAEARIRGLKISSIANVTTLLKLIKAHENGGAGQKNYDTPNVHANTPTDIPPQLGHTVKVRGSEFPETTNAFKETLHLLTSAIRIFKSRENELRRARLFQQLQDNKDGITCQICHTRTDLKVNLDCGHVLCSEHLAGKELCGDGTTHCQAVIGDNAVPIDDLRPSSRELELLPKASGHASSSRPRNYSSKVDCVTNIAKGVVLGDDSVVIFSQYDDMIQHIIQALKHNGIVAKTTSRLQNFNGTPGNMSNIIEAFKKKTFRVLVLKVDAPEASGANLVVANHIIFATPLSTPTQDLYETYMEQAKGRCARRGQTKDIFLYHCVVEGTIEVDILETRTKRHVRAQPGRALGWLLPRDAPDARLYQQDWSSKHGATTRVKSSLRQTEVWKAIGEVDYVTTLNFDKPEDPLKDTVGVKADQLAHKAWSEDLDFWRDIYKTLGRSKVSKTSFTDDQVAEITRRNFESMEQSQNGT
ncbi:hypothetical protein TruAng_006332 [Truncatella angustata]|nr:hypothetical protein TruAng_006332 [Truncatella angustata]